MGEGTFIIHHGFISFSLFVVFAGEQDGVLDLMVGFNLRVEVLRCVYILSLIAVAFSIDFYRSVSCNHSKEPGPLKSSKLDLVLQ